MKKILKKIIFIFLIIGIIVTSTLCWSGYKMYRNAIEEKPLQDAVYEIQQNNNYVVIDNLPDIYLEAVVAVEDHRFFNHMGVDLIAIGRAMCNNIRSLDIKEGRSTITQQLAKNIYFTHEKSIIRKIAECFMALELEKSYSKQEILELYVNTIYFGDGYYGIGNASIGYYNKCPSELSEYQSTLLAGLPNAPSAYSLSSNLSLAQKRQKHVINQMVKYGYITDAEAQLIVNSSN